MVYSKRDYRRRWEVDVIQLSAEFVEDLTKSKGDIRKLWQKALIFVKGKRGKKSILAGSGRYRNRHD